jgi:hypothetical protein
MGRAAKKQVGTGLSGDTRSCYLLEWLLGKWLGEVPMNMFYLTRATKQKYIVTLLFAVLLPITAVAQRGAQTTSRSLDQMAQQAEVIVQGHVVSAKVEPHPELKNLMTVLVTMSVEDTLKGKSRKSLQFRQYIWDVRDQLDSAQYQKGEELLLLLGPVSEYGLTSPVGLEQGRFHITRENNAPATAVNGRGNLGLFQSSEQRARAQGLKLSADTTALVRETRSKPVPLTDLKNAIRTFAEKK